MRRARCSSIAASAPELASNLGPVSQDQMVDILWQWTSLEEPPPAPGVGVGHPSLYDIVFRADGTYSAKADCNRLNGAYTLNGSQLTILPGISTLVACEPNSRADQYASLLWRVTGVAQKEGMLVLLVDEGTSAMSFVNAENLRWKRQRLLLLSRVIRRLSWDPRMVWKTSITPITGRISPVRCLTPRSRAGSL